MDNFIFPELKQRTVEDEITSRLRNAIIGGSFAPGSHLNETEVAKQMNVSRIPIREAIKKLEQEGLLVRHTNRRVFVVSFSAHDVKEVFSLRANLECMAFEWALPNMGQADYEALRELIAQQEKAVTGKDYEALARLDMRFHEYIVSKADHSRLLKSWYEQHAQSQMLLNVRFRKMSDYTPETVTRDHTEILESIQRNDIDAAKLLTLQISERVALECSQTLEEFLSTGDPEGGE